MDTYQARVLTFLAVVFTVIAMALSVGEYRLDQATTRLDAFRVSTCAVIAQSNQLEATSHALYIGNAQRAQIRFKADVKLGLAQAAQADLDAYRTYTQFAKETHQIHLRGC